MFYEEMNPNCYDMEQMELLADAMEEVAEWEEYIADMAEMPFGDGTPTEGAVIAMAEEACIW